MSNLKFILPYFKKYRLMLAAGFLSLMGCDLAQLAIPKVLGRAIDLLGRPQTARGDLFGPVAVILALALLVALMRYFWRRLIIGFSRLVEMELRGRLYGRLVRLSPRWHQANVSGDLMALATNDLEAVRMAISFGLISLVDALVMGLTALAFMAAISPALTLWAMVPMPFITLITRIFGQKVFRLLLETQTIFGQLTEVVREQLSGLKVIRAMGLTRLALGETEKTGQVYLNKNIRLAALMGLFFPFLHLMSNFAVALILYFGGRETMAGHISTGDFVAFISLLALLSWPMMALGMVFGILQQGLASLARLKNVFEAEADAGRPTGLTAPANPAPRIEMRNLHFRYPTRVEPALAGVDLVLEPDRITALVGPVGSGKSTLAALLPALNQAPPGSLYVGGQAVEDWPLAELRGLFGYVPQDGFMFSGTVLENLCFGKPEASLEEALAAAEIAGLTEDLKFFPQGLDTVVGERGLTLSGGQRQRLALARALVLDPAYLVMDDTLSAVDAAVEDGILKRLAARRKNRGALLITHRVTSLAVAARIVVLEHGRVTGAGALDELLAANDYFRRIYELARINLTAEGGEA